MPSSASDLFGSSKIVLRCLSLLLVVICVLGVVGQAQNVTVNPAGPVNFGSVTVGSNSTQTVVLSINAALTLTSMQTSGDYSVQSNSCGLNTPLFPGTMCSLQVQFAPTKPGQQWVPLVVTDSTSMKYSFGLQGTGIGAALAFSPGIINTVAGSATYGYAGDGGPATSAELNTPFAVAVGNDGTIYIGDVYNQRIRKVDNNGVITTLAGNGTYGYTGDGGPAIAAEITYPFGLALDSAGNLYFTDQQNSVVRKVDLNGNIFTIAGTGTPGFAGDGGPAIAALLDQPTGVAVDSAGNLYIADYNNLRIRKVDTNGVITTVVGNGYVGSNGDGGPAINASLEPISVAVDAVGNLYSADYGFAKIRKIDVNGIITTIAGNGTNGFSGDGGPALNAELFLPRGVAVDDAGDVYIADFVNNRTRKVDGNGIITTVAGNGLWDYYGFSGDGAAATNAEMNAPFSVAFGGTGNLYIADTFNMRIRKVDLTTSALGFRAQGVGQTSEVQVVTVTNAGNATLNLSAITISDNFQLRSVGNDCATGTPISVGGSCSIGIVFAPAVTGSPLTGTVTVADDAFNSPQLINLTGATPIAPTVTFIGAPASAPYGATFVVADTTNASTTAVITASGSCSVVGTLVTMTSGTGTCALTATWAADDNYTAATLSQYTMAMPGTSSTAITSNVPNPAGTGQTVTVSYTVTGAFTGTVNVTASTGESCVGPLKGGFGGCSLTFATIGTRTVTATYPGDGNVAGSTSPAVSENILTPGADLIEASVTLTTIAPISGGQLIVNDTVTNQGASTAGASWSRFYLSTNGTTKGTMLGTRSVPSLAGGATSPGSTVVSLPLNLSGTYYIIACADDTNAVVESNETNNCSFSAAVAISGADLAETAVFPTTTPGAGTTIVVSDTVSNKGGGNAGASWTRFYLSTNGTTKTTMLGSRSVPALTAGATSGPVNTNVTLPMNLNGQYFVIACADDTNAVVESNETNNCLASGAIQVSGADLVEASVYPPSTAAAGGTMSVIDTVTNQGGGNASNSWTRFYLSTNGTAKGTVLGTRTVPALIAGAGSGPVTTNLTVPMNTSGVYWVIACADDTNVVTESNETNNCRTSNAFQIAAADLIESTVSAPVSGGSGSVITVTDTATNQGGGNANSSWTRFYLSTNGTTKSTMLGSRSVPALATGISSGPVNTNLTLPLNLSGTYYIIACADDTNAVVESYENNNCTASGPIAVQ